MTRCPRCDGSGWDLLPADRLIVCPTCRGTGSERPPPPQPEEY